MKATDEVRGAGERRPGVADAPNTRTASRETMPGRSQFYQPETQARILKMLRSALGSTVCDLLDDPAVTEVSVNSDGTVWADKVGLGRHNTGCRSSVEATLRSLFIVADAKGEHIGEDNPDFDALLPGHGYRFHGTLPPLTAGPSLTVRKKPERVITLAEYEEARIITAAQHHALVKVCEERENIIIAGGTGSGKTTLANGILQVMTKTGHRIITIEDTPELQNSAEDRESMYTIPKVRTMQDCLKGALRMHPDRLVFGEVRGAEVRDMLMAWNTGHRGGLCTIHSDSALDALYRIEEMLETIPNYQPRPRQIARAIQILLFIQTTADRANYPSGRYVRELVRVKGHSEQGGYILEPIL